MRRVLPGIPILSGTLINGETVVLSSLGLARNPGPTPLAHPSRSRLRQPRAEFNVPPPRSPRNLRRRLTIIPAAPCADSTAAIRDWPNALVCCTAARAPLPLAGPRCAAPSDLLLTGSLFLARRGPALFRHPGTVRAWLER